MADRDSRLDDEVDELLEPHGRARREGDRGWRAGLRRTRGGRIALKTGVFLLGLVFIGLGVAAVVLPGPLTIPPMLLGLYIWASEFEWADALFQRAKKSGLEAWAKAKTRPVSSAVVTIGGLALAAAAVVAVQRYDVVDRITGSL